MQRAIPRYGKRSGSLRGCFKSRGAKVRIARVPQSQNVNGPDDYLAAFGDESTLRILDSATAPSAAFPAPRGSCLLGSGNFWRDLRRRLIGFGKGRWRRALFLLWFQSPKVGKSTFSRNLCLAVSRGEEFLGLRTKGGLCIYLALEERVEDVTADFRAMVQRATNQS